MGGEQTLMDLQDIKSSILSQKPIHSLLIFKYSDINTRFICLRYLDALTKGKTRINISSITEINLDDPFATHLSDVYVMDVDELVEHPTSAYSQLIIICKKLPSDLTVDYIDIPKVEP